MSKLDIGQVIQEWGVQVRETDLYAHPNKTYRPDDERQEVDEQQTFSQFDLEPFTKRTKVVKSRSKGALRTRETCQVRLLNDGRALRRLSIINAHLDDQRYEHIRMRYADCLVKQVARPIDQVDRTAILDLLFAYNRLYGVGPGCLADLSRLVNVPVYLLQQIVSGQKVDTALTLDVLADAIGCSQSELSYKHYFVDHAIKELDSIELETLDDSYGWRDTTTYKVKQIEFGPLKAKLPNKKFTDALMYAKSKLVIETFNQRLLEMAKRYDVRPRLIDYVKWYEFGATPEQFGFEFDESGRYLLDSESREILAHFPIDDLVEPTANENISKYMDRLESVLDDVDCGGKPDIIKQRAPKSRYKVKNVGGRAKIGSVTQSEAKKIKAKHNQSKQ